MKAITTNREFLSLWFLTCLWSALWSLTNISSDGPSTSDLASSDLSLSGMGFEKFRLLAAPFDVVCNCTCSCWQGSRHYDISITLKASVRSTVCRFLCDSFLCIPALLINAVWSSVLWGLFLSLCCLCDWKAEVLLPDNARCVTCLIRVPTSCTNDNLTMSYVWRLSDGMVWAPGKIFLPPLQKSPYMWYLFCILLPNCRGIWKIL